MKDQNDELYAIIGEVKIVRIKGIEYKISACSMSELPKLQKLMNQFDTISDGDSDINSLDINGEAITLMARIIRMGLKENHPEMTLEKIRDKFPLSSLPVIINIMMDLNDFLSAMRGLRQKLIQ